MNCIQSDVPSYANLNLKTWTFLDHNNICNKQVVTKFESYAHNGTQYYLIPTRLGFVFEFVFLFIF
jgi:hypothetical protein